MRLICLSLFFSILATNFAAHGVMCVGFISPTSRSLDLGELNMAIAMYRQGIRGPSTLDLILEGFGQFDVIFRSDKFVSKAMEDFIADISTGRLEGLDFLLSNLHRFDNGGLSRIHDADVIAQGIHAGTITLEAYDTIVHRIIQSRLELPVPARAKTVRADTDLIYLVSSTLTPLRPGGRALNLVNHHTTRTYVEYLTWVSNTFSHSTRVWEKYGFEGKDAFFVFEFAVMTRYELGDGAVPKYQLEEVMMSNYYTKGAMEKAMRAAEALEILYPEDPGLPAIPGVFSLPTQGVQ